MNKTIPFILQLSLIACSMFVAGCGKNPRSPIVFATGTIGFTDGSKLPAGTLIAFSPVLGGAECASAEVQQDGSFRLVHASGAAGAEEGDYLVQLVSPKGMEADFYKSVPETYTDGGKLLAKVPPGGGEIKLVLKKSR